MSTHKINSFTLDDKKLLVVYVETMQVKEGVSCDVYSFKDDDSKDLAIVTVDKGHKTPLQRILKGKTTIEGFVSGKGILNVTSSDGEARRYEFDEKNPGEPVLVYIGDLMQWHANGDRDLVFYEVCTPPYEDGRFENLPENGSTPTA